MKITIPNLETFIKLAKNLHESRYMVPTVDAMHDYAVYAGYENAFELIKAIGANEARSNNNYSKHNIPDNKQNMNFWQENGIPQPKTRRYASVKDFQILRPALTEMSDSECPWEFYGVENIETLIEFLSEAGGCRDLTFLQLTSEPGHDQQGMYRMARAIYRKWLEGRPPDPRYAK